MTKVKFVKDEGVLLPQYQSEYASGFDVVAHEIMMAYKGDTPVDEEKLKIIQEGFNERGYIKLRAFERIMFSTGLTLADVEHDKEGFRLELQMRSRSGISLKKGVFVVNQPGTIDEDYRGKIGVILYNSSPFLVTIEKDERVGQLVPTFVPRVEIKESKTTTKTKRGSKGFGSTGDK